jgi:hypothetical protein
MLTPLPLRFQVSMAIPRSYAGLLVSCVSLGVRPHDRHGIPSCSIPSMASPSHSRTIFDDAGISLTVEEDDTGIQPLNIAQDECISDAELVDARKRPSPPVALFPTAACPFAFCNTYHLYGAVVDHYGEVLDVCLPEFVLGKMWQGHTRSAFAVFYRMNTIQSDGACLFAYDGP